MTICIFMTLTSAILKQFTAFLGSQLFIFSRQRTEEQWLISTNVEFAAFKKQPTDVPSLVILRLPPMHLPAGS